MKSMNCYRVRYIIIDFFIREYQSCKQGHSRNYNTRGIFGDLHMTFTKIIVLQNKCNKVYELLQS